MPGVRTYEQEYIDACRSRVDAQVAMWEEVARAARARGDSDMAELEGALESLESEYFNNMLLVLDTYFVHRLPELEGEDGNPLNEVRVLARSLMRGGGTVMADTRIDLEPRRSVLGLSVGDPVRLTERQYNRLSNAFFQELQRKFTDKPG